MPEETKETVPSSREAQAQEPVIEWQGQKMPASEFVKKHEAAVREMNEAQRKSADQERTISEYQSWADPIRERYSQDPEGFKTWWGSEESLQGGGGSPNVLDPAWQRLESQDREIARLRMERDLDNLQSRGYEMDDDIRRDVARKIATDPSVRSVEAAYKTLMWDKAITKARESAVADTAQALKAGRSVKPMPEGKAPTATPPDLSKLSREDRRDLAVERIKDMPFFSGE